jgi:Raf kinase inhibitor-like YbhB/YbcL family protein
MDIEVLSPAFKEGEAIPIQYTCDDANVSPPLRWGGIPKNSQSLAIICEDPDAPSGVFVHWVIFDLPPIVASLPEAEPATKELVESGAIQGRNDFMNIGYDGPCPPPGKPHRYFFHLMRSTQSSGLRQAPQSRNSSARRKATLSRREA